MSKLIIDNKYVLGLPLNEYYVKNEKYNGLIFLQHGFGSKKERGTDYLAINLARLGYLCVSIDAYKHGQRIEEPFISEPIYKQYLEAFNVIENTSKDIDYLFKNHYKKKYKNYIFIGISLGGMVGYYLSTISKDITKLIPVISTPMFTKLSLQDRKLDEQDLYDKYIVDKQEYIKNIDPYLNKDKMHYDKIFIVNGVEDNVISYKHSKEFYNEIKGDKSKLKLYKEKHNVSREMQEDILSFVVNDKVVL